MKCSSQNKEVSTSEISSNARETLLTLRDQLTHCEDMLKYLPSGGEASCFSDEIDICVTNYTIKLNKHLQRNGAGVPPECIQSRTHSKTYSACVDSEEVGRTLRLQLSKPEFKQVPQASCHEIMEVDELNTSISWSFGESNDELPSDAAGELSPAQELQSRARLWVKSPKYIMRSEAELKVKDLMLNCFTK